MRRIRRLESFHSHISKISSSGQHRSNSQLSINICQVQALSMRQLVHQLSKHQVMELRVALDK